MGKVNKRDTVEKIVDLLGGKENISNYTHCVTRLRFNLREEKRADVTAIEKLEGVMGTAVKGGQYQIIMGLAVGEYFKEVEGLFGKAGGEGGSDKKLPESKKKFSVMTILDVLTSIIAPVIPAFCAAGMMKVVLLSLMSLGICTGAEATYQVFDFISDVAFYFLPVLIAMSSAKRFQVDQGLAIVVAAALLYPTFVSAVADGETMSVFGVGVPMYSYSSTIFPALLGVWLLSYVYRFWDRVVKIDALKLLLVPLLSLAVTVPATFLVLAPLGNWGASILAGAFSWMINTIGPFAGLIIGFLMPVMTLTGLHQSLSPVELMEMSTFGFSRILPLELLHNFAEAGAALGTAVASKDKKMKSVATQTGFTAFVGVTEPALYSVMTADKWSMASAMIANGIGGFLGVLLAVKGFAFVWPNLFSLPSFIGPGSTVLALGISLAATFGTGFVLPIIFGRLGLTDFVLQKKE